MISAILAMLILQQTAPAAASPPPVTAFVPVKLPAATAVRLVTETTIDSRTARQGQRFTIIVADDVTVNGKLVFPKGTRAVGEVEALTGKGMFGKSGSLVLRPLFIEYGGQRINLDGVVEQSGKEQVGGAAVATFAAGGLGLIITGKSAVIPAGSEIRALTRNTSEIVLPLR